MATIRRACHTEEVVATSSYGLSRSRQAQTRPLVLLAHGALVNEEVVDATRTIRMNIKVVIWAEALTNRSDSSKLVFVKALSTRPRIWNDFDDFICLSLSFGSTSPLTRAVIGMAFHTLPSLSTFVKARGINNRLISRLTSRFGGGFGGSLPGVLVVVWWWFWRRSWSHCRIRIGRRGPSPHSKGKVRTAVGLVLVLGMSPVSKYIRGSLVAPTHRSAFLGTRESHQPRQRWTTT